MDMKTEMLTATISFRLTDEECHTLAVRADREQRTVSQLVRLLLRTYSDVDNDHSEQAWKKKHGVA